MPMKRNSRILFITRRLQREPTDGSSAYSGMLIEWLQAEVRDFHILWVTDKPEGCRFVWREPRHVSAFKGSLHVPGWVKWGGWHILALPKRWLSHIMQIVSPWLYQRWMCASGRISHKDAKQAIGGVEKSPVSSWDRLCSRAETGGIRSIIRELDPDVIVVNYAYLLSFLEGGFREQVKGRVAVVTHDVLSERSNALGGSPLFKGLRWTQEMEASLLSRADAVVAITGQDAEAFRRLVPSNTRVLTMPMCVEVKPVQQIESKSGRVLFVANTAEHNVEGLAWFLEAVWPRIRQVHPGAVLRVVGSIQKCFEPKLGEGVDFAGFVDDLSGEYREAAVVVAPLIHGSGLKIKVVEALAYGKAMVATPAAAQGIREGEMAMRVVPVDAEDFSAAVGVLLQDDGSRHMLESAARALAIKEFSREACFRDFSAWLSFEPVTGTNAHAN